VQRWPLYLRQAKAVLRAADETFDERKYGFSGLVEALRFGQKEGLFRLDRDRQGVLRVYPGQLLQRVAGSDGAAPGSALPAEPADVSLPLEEIAPLAGAGADGGTIEDAPAPILMAEAAEMAKAPGAAKNGRRRAGAAKKAAPARKAAAKPRAAKTAAPRKRGGRKAAEAES
jgi:hypothetical protein